MERVQYSLERTLPQLRVLDEHGILTKDELRSLTSQRQSFEARLIRRKADKNDFIRYLEFEDDLHALIMLRARERNRLAMERVKSGDEDAKSQLLPRSFFPKQAAHSSAHCVAIFERMVLKFRWDLDAWERYISWAKKRKMRVVAGRVYARALAMHPMQPALWLSAADYELNTHADTTAARTLLQRAIRTNKLTEAEDGRSKAQRTSRGASRVDAYRWRLSSYEQDVLRLWVEYFRMELVFMERLRRRWRVIAGDDADEDAAAAEQAVAADVPEADTHESEPQAPAEGHDHIRHGAIPLVVLDSIRTTVPRSLQLFVYVALLQLLSSFPFSDSLVVKQHGDVISLRTTRGVQGQGDALREKLMQGVLHACDHDTLSCLFPLYHALPSAEALPASQTDQEQDTHAVLHGASQLHGTYSSAIDSLYTYANVPDELRDTGIVAGANDPWMACQPVILLLEVMRQRFMQDEHATPYLRMLTKKGDLPAVVQHTVSLFRGHPDESLPFLVTLCALSTRFGLDEPHLLAYLSRVQTQLTESLDVPWLAMDTASDRAQEPDETQRMNPCAWLAFSHAAEWNERTWDDALHACIAQQADAPVWGLLVAWQSNKRLAYVSPSIARAVLWRMYLEWVPTSTKNTLPLYKRAVQTTGAVLASSQLLGTARARAQTLHDDVVRQVVVQALPDEQVLSMVLSISSASTSCWLAIADDCAQSASQAVDRVYQRAVDQAEREGNVADAMQAWLAYLAHLAQKDMRRALTELAHASTRLRTLGGADAVVALEQQWQTLL